MDKSQAKRVESEHEYSFLMHAGLDSQVSTTLLHAGLEKGVAEQS